MKLYYWCPFFSNVATEKAVLNSIKSVIKFSKKKINPYLLDVIGEWENQKFNFTFHQQHEHLQNTSLQLTDVLEGQI